MSTPLSRQNSHSVSIRVPNDFVFSGGDLMKVLNQFFELMGEVTTTLKKDGELDMATWRSLCSTVDAPLMKNVQAAIKRGEN